MVDLKLIKPKNLWYAIGLIASDGNLSKDDRHIDITSKDRKYLYSVRKILGIKSKLGRKSRGSSKEKRYSALQFGDVNFYRYLVSLGLTQAKSLTLGKMKIEHKYFSDFLRGVIDGDGCISTWIHKTNLHRQWSLRVTSAAPIFINWLKNETESYFKVRGRLHTYYNRGYQKNPICILKFGKLAAKIILQQIYYKNAFCLNRKNLKCIKCLRDENKMINYGGVLCPGAGTGRQPRLKIE